MDPEHNAIAIICFRFPQSIESGLLEVIAPPADFYPDMDNLKQTFGDTQERVK